MEFSFLDKINNPDDLKKIAPKHLPEVCNELRHFIIDKVSKYGGHFGASLGVVELTVALHYVYQTPYDQLVWDVGHQAYGHKILTGRRDVFHTNRKYKGISGFPKRDESEYDAFGVGHSSTSISAALGMALASKIKNDSRKHVAIIGDASIAAGIAFEALNHAGSSQADLLIILNDNCMGIDPNVGSLKEYLTSITTSSLYNKMRDEIWKIFNSAPMGKQFLLDTANKLDTSIKNFIAKNSNIFESLNIRYFGPVDGHNVNKLTDTLKDLKKLKGVNILHIVTVKGKGFALAEQDQTFWHAPGLFDKDTGKLVAKTSSQPTPPKYQDVFGKTIIELAKQNPNIIGITPAMPSGSSLKFMIEQMPDKAFDVGICEQHAVTVSAGLATQGMKVFCNIYSTFMQRAYDQVIHDVAIQNIPVIFCLDRAGLVGEDGATHHGLYDLAYMRCIPNLIIGAPMNEKELRDMMFTAQLDEIKNPFVIRYPRGNGAMIDWQTPFEKIEIGKGECIKKGTSTISVLSVGHIGNAIKNITTTLQNENISISHYNMRFVKPLDEALLHNIFQQYEYIITIEDAAIIGGFGSAIAEFMVKHQYTKKIKMFGVPDKVVEHGTPQELYKECGLDDQHIINTIKEIYKK